MGNHHPDRAAGLRRLDLISDALGGRYAQTRGFDFGPERRGNVSMLSPYIRHRLLLEREVLDAAIQRHGVDAADKFVQEVFWRTYFKGWLEQHPSVWTDYRNGVAHQIQQLSDSAGLLDRYQDAISGNIGIDCFDSWASELTDTGYLHNHARMWFASIWVFTLKLPWQLGADFFYRHLVDGDPASNTLGWRWVSGLHTKGKNYLARASGIENFSAGRFNPSGQLASTAAPLKESALHPLQKLPLQQRLDNANRFGLLITEEDSYPETLPLDGVPSAIIGLAANPDRSPLPVGEQAVTFTNGAVKDALCRAGVHFQIGVERADGDDWANAVADWARQHDLDTVATAYVPVGPTAERIALVAEELQKHRIRFVQIRRGYDSVCWPHAQQGFFKLKKQIPQLLHSLGIQNSDDIPRRNAS
ncbi:MAG: DNA photolyase [Gammaproteobacteria bacterium]|nr:DNA photolyase [Gammaproteobacteria bacterium]